MRTNRKVNGYLFSFRTIILLLVLCIILSISPQLHAQGTAQVIVTGIPGILPSPYFSDLERNYFAGRYQMQFIYNSTNTQPVDFRFTITLSKDGRDILNTTSDVVSYTPGTYIYRTFDDQPTINFSDNVFDSFESRLAEQIIRGGVLPEGDYMLEIEAVTDDQFAMVSSVGAVVPFQVRFPHPPFLLSPADLSGVLIQSPVFSWTPVTGISGVQFEYELLIVEVFERQTPLQAIRANREHARIITNQTTVIYSRDLLPLEEGKSYAWQVTARSADGTIPVSDDGRSEIYTFTFGDDPGRIVDRLEDLRSITLVPNLAVVTDLDRLEVIEESAVYILNGAATLEVTLPDNMERIRLRTTVNNLRIQKGNLANPVILGGTVRSNAERSSILPQIWADHIIPGDLTWQLGEGLTLEGSIRLTDGSMRTALGKISILPSGLSGSLRVLGSPDAPLFVLGGNPVELKITEIEALFPQNDFTAKTALTIYQADTPCSIGDLNLFSEEISTTIFCSGEGNPVSLSGGSDLLMLEFQSISGDLSVDFTNPSIEYDLDGSASLQFTLADENRCGLLANFLLSSNDGFSAAGSQATCNTFSPVIDLGFFYIEYKNLALTEFAFDQTTGEWDFEITLDAQFRIPAFDDVSLPEFEGVRISRPGIEIPSVSFDQFDLASVDPFGVEEFPVRLQTFSIEEILLSWNDIDTGAEWDFLFEGEAGFPDDDRFPGCLRNKTLLISGAHTEGDLIYGNIQPQDLLQCSWQITPYLTVLLDSFDGRLGAEREADGSWRPYANLTADGSVQFDGPFECDDDRSAGASNVTINFESASNFTVTNFVPDCPVAIGPFEAQVLSSSLVVRNSSNPGLSALLSADANLQFTDGAGINGSFVLDLVTGRFVSLNFEIDRPFVWGIPNNDPIITFRITQAALSEEGFFIDGRNEVLFNGTSINVTFDNVLLGMQEPGILGGSIIFDEAFAVEIGIDDAIEVLSLGTVPVGSSLTKSPGVLFELAGTVRLDSTGVHTSGSAAAQFHFGDQAFEQLSVEYTDDFKFSFDPFGVVSGRADLLWEDQRIAYMDQHGIHPDPTYFLDQIIPDRIPLPLETIAYVELKRNDEFLVNAVSMDDGYVRLDTKPGETVDFVFPVLQGDQATPPTIQVSFSDVRINPYTRAVTAGVINVGLTGTEPFTDLSQYGIPLDLEEIAYRAFEIDGANVSGLFFDGALKLFEHSFDTDGMVSLYIQNDGVFRGTFEIDNISEEIPVVGGSTNVLIVAEHLTGDVNIPALNPQHGTFTFSIDGGFVINTDAGYAARADIGAQFTEGGFTLTHFDVVSIGEPMRIDFDFLEIGIDKIHTLEMAYNFNPGFTFFAGLDMYIRFNTSDGSSFEIPLRNVEISESGFSIPVQNIHPGVVPGFDPPVFEFFGIGLQPLALTSTEPITFDWFSGESFNFKPMIDLELTFPGFHDIAPSLAQSTITLNSVQFDEGFLTGSILPYQFDGDGLPLELGDLTLLLEEIGGEIRREVNGDAIQQVIDIAVSGEFGEIAFLSDEEGDCEPAAFTLNITGGRGLSGSLTNFTPCGIREFGPLALEISSSTVEFEFIDDTQHATLSGGVDVHLPHPHEAIDRTTVSGSLSLNLLTGHISGGAIIINNPFLWHLPLTAETPFFTMTINQARLDSAGLMLQGAGEIRVGDVVANVQLNDLLIDLQTLQVADGNAIVSSDIALEIGLMPLEWRIADPDDSLPNNSLRMNFTQSIQLDESGIGLSGSGNAMLDFAGESYSNLSLTFEDEFTVGWSPLRVTQGRANLYYNDDLLAYYDRFGLHIGTDVFIPDTLGLPNKEIAYLVLRDEQGNVKINTTKEGDNWKVDSTSPLELHIPALDDRVVLISFDELLVDDSFTIVGGSITASSVIDLDPLPIKLTGVTYGDAGGVYRLTASGEITLPEVLEDLELLFDDLEIGPDGLAGTFSAGAFTHAHTEDDEAYLVHREFADGALGLYVRGIVVGFGGDTPVIKFSGDLTSTLFSDDDGDAALIHYAVWFEDDAWDMSIDAAHLPNNEIPLGVAYFSLDELNFDFEEFAVILSGQLTVPELLGDEFIVTIAGLKVGPAGVSVESVDASSLLPQQLSLFNDIVQITLNDLRIPPIADNILRIELDGSLSFLESNFTFTNMRIGSDGSFGIGSGEANLLAQPLPVLGQYLTLNTLQLIVVDSSVRLQATGETVLPEPFSSSAGIALSIDRHGSISVDGPDFVFENTEINLADLAIFAVTGAGLQIQPQHPAETVFYASARLTISEKNVHFGQPGSPQNWGIRYQKAGPGLQWKITSADNLDFDARFFRLQINPQNVALDEQETATFRMRLDGRLSLLLDDNAGSVDFEGFTFTSERIESFGRVTGGSFSLMGIADLTVGSFDYGENETIRISGDPNDPNNPVVEKHVDEYVIFTGNNGDALKLSFGAAFTGSIEEVVYYRNAGSLYFNVRNVRVEMNDFAELYASMEYLNEDGNFLLRVAGGGKLGGPDGVGIAAFGKFSNLNNQLSFGIFVSVQAPVPIIPAVIELSQVGGGFFYNPDPEDITQAFETVKYETYNPSPPWEHQSGWSFAVMLHAGIRLITVGNAYAVEGETFVLITDDFFAIDARGKVFNMPEERFSAGMYLSVQFPGDRVIIGAGGGVKADFPLIMQGNFDIEFSAVKQDSQPLLWAFTGSGDIKLTGGIINASANIIASNKGFLVNLSVSTGFDFWVIRVDAGFDGSVWWIFDDGFGAYVEIAFEASLFGGVAKIGATAKGALVRDSRGNLIYAAARAYVSVLFVFDGNVSIWISLYNGKFDGGRGSNPAFEQMIAAAQQQAQSMEDEMAALAGALDDAKNAPVVFETDPAILEEASVNLLMSPHWVRAVISVLMEQNELKLLDSLPQDFRNVTGRVIVGNQNPERPSTSRPNDYLAQMNQKIAELQQKTPPVADRLTATNAEAVEWLAEVYEIAGEMQSPIDDFRSEWLTGPQGELIEPPTFTINEQRAEDHRESLENLKASIEALDQQYQQAIGKVIENINKIDEAVSGRFSLGFAIVGYSPQGFPIFGPSGDPIYELSVNEAAALFTQTVESIGRFYAARAAYLWQFRNWAQIQHGHLIARQWNINNAVNQTANLVSANTHDDAIDVAKNRIRFIHTLAGKSESEIQAQENQVYDWSSPGTQGFRNNFIQTGNELWYDMHNLGLPVIRNNAQTMAEQVRQEYSSKMQTVAGAHRAFTKSMDRLYSIKAEMTATLYGMMDEYIGWRTDVFEDDEDTQEWRDRLLAVEKTLMPPIVSGIVFQRTPRLYENKARIYWVAYQDGGEIIETSYRVGTGTSTNIYATGYTSAGRGSVTGGTLDINYIDHYTFKRNLNERTRNYNVGIRARGESGNTAARVGTFQLAVDSGGSNSSNGNIMVTTTQPPTTPNVHLPYRQIGGYWTNDPHRIEITATAYDATSDIAAFEYKIGTSQGGNDVVDWRVAQGIRTFAGGNTGGLANTQLKFLIRNLNLEPGEAYYVSVRAKNGAGIYSAVRELSVPVRYDDTPPSAPVHRAQGVTFPPVQGYGGIITSIVTNAPLMDNPPTNITKATPSVTISWGAASDNESGIWKYEYVIGSSDNPEMAFGQNDIKSTTNTSITIADESLNFSDEYYVHVRSVNNAGTMSESVVTYGPFVVRDPSRPRTPKVYARVVNNNIWLYLARPPYDLETDIEGVQYGVGTSSNLGGTNLRALPSGSQTDNISLGWGAILAGMWIGTVSGDITNPWPGNISAPYYVIPKDGLPEGQELYIHYRGVNKQGMHSAVARSGPIILDSTPPPSPTISVGISSDGSSLNMNVSNIRDPESGISRVQYRVINHVTGQVVLGWSTFITVNGISHNTLSGTRSMALGNHNAFDLRVEIRTTNGAGLASTHSGQVPLQFNNFNFDYTFQTFSF